jgi:hypothetical protein
MVNIQHLTTNWQTFELSPPHPSTDALTKQIRLQFRKAEHNRVKLSPVGMIRSDVLAPGNEVYVKPVKFVHEGKEVLRRMRHSVESGNDDHVELSLLGIPQHCVQAGATRLGAGDAHVGVLGRDFASALLSELAEVIQLFVYALVNLRKGDLDASTEKAMDLVSQRMARSQAPAGRQ